MTDSNQFLIQAESELNLSDPLFRSRTFSRWAGSAFAAPVIPLVLYFATRLRDRYRALEIPKSVCAFDEETFVDTFLQHLDKRLSRALNRTIILEINVARTLGELTGETPEERFADFVMKMKVRERRERFFADYPILLDVLRTLLQNWYDASAEFAERLRDDHAELESVFSENLGPLVGFANQSGDSHNRGRSVLIAVFQTGTRVVYKPHDVEVDVRFHEFLGWLKEKGFTDPYIAKTLAKKNYGWTEFISYLPCENEKEVELFYLRTGQLLSALYLIGATDVHSENLIARGGYPIVVDVETLFHPHVQHSNQPSDQDTARTLFPKLFMGSVVKTELMPRLKGSTPDSAADMSGLGGQAGQKTAIRGQSVSAVGTDEVRVTDATYTTGQVQNRPRLEGQTDVLPIHGDLLVEGFTDGYEILLENKDELREFLNRFRTVQIRAVPRNTADYFQVLVNSYHPDVLGQPGYREQVTHSLEPAAKNFPNLGKLLPSERTQILEGDIPYFVTTPTSNDLLGGDGMLIKDSIAESGWSIFERKLERFGVDDLRLQREILRASMASMFGFNTYRLSPIKLSKPYETYIDAARAIGDHLNEAAIRQSETLTWLSLESKGRHQLTNQNIYQVTQTGLGLYEGITGLGFFFDSLYKVTGEDQYKKTVEQVCRTLDHSPEMMNLTPSAFNGLGSLVYFFSHLGRVPAVENLANRMDPAKGAKVPDIISGHAGSILALLAGGIVSPTSLKKAIEFGDALVNFLKEGSTLPIQRGFSHGFGGLGFALEKLGERTGVERFLAASRQAFEKEDSLIKGENWTDPDYFNQNGGHHQATWCHGLPGLALARMSSRDSTARSFASMSLGQMTDAAANHGLCHGALGNIDVLIEGAKHLPDGERWMMAAHTWGRKALTETKERGLRTAFPLFFENPGLMTGLAGIGYGFLRLARPDLPCVLTLEGPSRSK